MLALIPNGSVTRLEEGSVCMVARASFRKSAKKDTCPHQYTFCCRAGDYEWTKTSTLPQAHDVAIHIATRQGDVDDSDDLCPITDP